LRGRLSQARVPKITIREGHRDDPTAFSPRDAGRDRGAHRGPRLRPDPGAERPARHPAEHDHPARRATGRPAIRRSIPTPTSSPSTRRFGSFSSAMPGCTGCGRVPSGPRAGPVEPGAVSGVQRRAGQHPDGSIWFTDPPYGDRPGEGHPDEAGGPANPQGIAKPAIGEPDYAAIGGRKRELPTAVYRWDPSGKLEVVVPESQLPRPERALLFARLQDALRDQRRRRAGRYRAGRQARHPCLLQWSLLSVQRWRPIPAIQVLRCKVQTTIQAMGSSATYRPRPFPSRPLWLSLPVHRQG
jgi:hypothetical protein